MPEAAGRVKGRNSISNRDIVLDKIISVRDNLNMKIEFTLAARKGLRNIPAREQSALLAKIEAFARGDILPPKVIKPFSLTTGRIRHGEWRATYVMDAATDRLIVDQIGHRREIYK